MLEPEDIVSAQESDDRPEIPRINDRRGRIFFYDGEHIVSEDIPEDAQVVHLGEIVLRCEEDEGPCLLAHCPCYDGYLVVVTLLEGIEGILR